MTQDIDLSAIDQERERIRATYLAADRPASSARGLHHCALISSDVERRVAERVRAGLPTLSVVAATGLPLTEEYQRGIEDGVLVAREMFSEITRDGVRFDDGSEVAADAILWATGFRASLRHLAPLRLREPGGGIRMDGTTVVRDPRVQLVGFGPSASTLGAPRAGRAAARAAVVRLRLEEAA